MAENRRFDIGKSAEELVPDSTSRMAYFTAIVITILGGAVIAALWKKLPSVVPLYFTEPWGEARLGAKQEMFLLPGLSLVTIIINLILGRAVTKKVPLLTRVLAVASVTLAVMFAVAILGIVQSLFL